jgi:hypothetical protein
MQPFTQVSAQTGKIAPSQAETPPRYVMTTRQPILHLQTHLEGRQWVDNSALKGHTDGRIRRRLLRDAFQQEPNGHLGAANGEPRRPQQQMEEIPQDPTRE